mgnify:CR=1 FL=1|tara:strand:+ start:155938 stop:156969 length:1032 start_codon:yes stop_codon:yes gene_type:complete
MTATRESAIASNDLVENDRDNSSNQGTWQKLRAITTRPWWPWLMHALKFAFFIGVTYLIVTQARTVHWDEVLVAIKEKPLTGLWLAGAFAIGSHLLYSCFDLLGRYVTEHGLPKLRVVMITLISYAFSLNLGTLVGGAGFRFRLYSRFGLDAKTITRVIVTSMFTNWFGYCLLAGLAFGLSPLKLPPDWKIDNIGMHVIGITLIVVAIAYLVLCAFANGRSWTIKGHPLTVSSLRFSLLQLVMSCTNWMLMAGVLYVLFEQKIAYTDVLCVFLVAAIAGVITHVPGGLGVTESVFVGFLSYQMPSKDLLAALLIFRTIYYFIPLGMATITYLVVEARLGTKKT